MKLTQDILSSKAVELSQESMATQAANGASTSVVVRTVSADQISLSYQGMPGNQPNSYGNYVGIWQNSDSIPWNTEPLKTQPIPANTPDGDMVFSGLDVTVNSYIIGYTVGPELSGSGTQKNGNACATATVPAIGGGSPNEFMPTVTVQYIGATSISVDFRLPSGILPQSNGAWIGLWRAGQASYNNPPEAANNIQVDAGQGSAFINGITIGRGLTYTVGLFMSGWGGGSSPNNQKTMACSVTFTT